MSKKATWMVNGYHAAACVTTGEINRKMKEVFDKTDNFPKSFQLADPDGTWNIDASKIGNPGVSFATDLKNGVNLDTPIETGTFKDSTWEVVHGNPKKKTKTIDLKGINFTLQTNMGNIEHMAGGYVLVEKSIADLKKGGVSATLIATIRGPLENRNFLTSKQFLDGVKGTLVDSAGEIIRDHASVVVNASLYANLTKDKVSPDCVNIQKNAGLQSTYADLEAFWGDFDPDGCVLDTPGMTADKADEAVSYNVTKANFATISGLNKIDAGILAKMKTAVADKTLSYGDLMKQIQAAVASTIDPNAKKWKDACYVETLDVNFTVQALYADLDSPHILTDLETSKDVKMPYSTTGLDLQQVLTKMIKDPSYKNNYVFGISKLPNVKATTGPFTPRSMRFSAFQLKSDKTKGSLNWNVMVSADQVSVPLPDLDTHATAGTFDEMPVPDHVPGVMIVSYGKIIDKLILPNGFKKMGLTHDKFTNYPKNAQAKLNADVDLDCSDLDDIHKGTFTTGNTKIYPDPDNNRIKIDFVIDHIQLADKYEWPEAVKGGVLGIIAKLSGHTPRYKATWSGYVTFSLDTQNKLTASYSQDTPNLSISDDEGAWRVILDITSLGLHELDRFLDFKVVDSGISSYVADNGADVLPNLVNVVELPGNAVFAFTSLDWNYLGLRAHLNYK